MNVWTEYPPYHPIRALILELRKRGKRALAGTSANKSGKPTCICPKQVFETFKGDVAAVLSDSFEHLPPGRRKSTTVIDLTDEYPCLQREGNVSETEVRDYLIRLGFPNLMVSKNVVEVQGHKVN